MKVFKDYDFLAKYVRSSRETPVHLRMAAFVADGLGVNSVLDIGGGSSSYVQLLKNSNNTAVVDVSAESLRKVVAGKKLVGMLPKLGIDERYDFVSALEVLEHLDPDSYEDSLREIGRVSSRYVFVTSPFLQDLYGAYALCDKCGVEFQCEGHCRSLGFAEIFAMQSYFGGLRDVYFCGVSQGGYASFAVKTNLKKIVRRILQISVRAKYCRPPFTKCPECGHEIFNDYDGYLNKCGIEESTSGWWKWRESHIVSGRFGALYDKNTPSVNGVTSVEKEGPE